MALNANLVRDPKKTHAYTIADFEITFGKEEINKDQLLAKVKALQMAFGGNSYKED